MATPAESTLDLEKAGQVTFQTGPLGTGAHTPSDGIHHGHHYTQRVRRRLHHFLHPESGKRIHVASSPEEAAKIRRHLETQHEPHEFDVCISGSAEHLSALREAQAHHEDRREALRTEHGDIYDRFASVHDELNALSTELDRVATHGVSLTAHFDKFGYDAHIKTYDDDDSPHASGSGTPRSSFSGTTRAGEDGSISSGGVERGFATPLKLFKVPVVRQYFHKGVLWRSSGAEEVMSFELFVDLLYVGIMQITGDAAAEDPTGYSLVKFIVTFLLSWKIWNDNALIVSWFEVDDILQRLSIILLLACLFGQTTNVTEAFEHTWPTLIGFYIAARLGMGVYLSMVAFLVPMIRGIMIFHVVTMLIGVVLWIGTIYLEHPTQLALIFVALVVDTFGAATYIIVMVICEKSGPKAKAWFDSVFEFFPAINIEHRTERMNAFVSLVFGYSVVALLYQSTHNGIDAHYGKAALGLTQAFCFNWLYFEVDGSNLDTHAIRRHKFSAMGWHTSHMPFVMGYVLGGGGLSRLVLAVDTPDSHLDALTERYQEHAEEHVAPGIRWFYCAGFGVALISMGLISIAHVHRNIPGLRLRKCWRLCGRFAVGVILICLPLAHDLNSTQLVGTVTGLVVLVLGLELWADSSCEESLFGNCGRKKRYFGHCPKKHLQAFIKEGKEVNHDMLSNQRLRDSGFVVAPT